jgi:MFS family permease
MPSGVATAAGPAARVPGAGAALALLLVINLFNYIDRQVLSAVLPKLKRDAALFDPADPWVQTKLGALATAFMVAYMFLSPVFAWAGDFVRRWWLVGLGVALWSLASGSSGLAATYLLLLLTRAFVGVGEAAYGPIAPAMLSDLYPAADRGKVMAWFYAAIPVGSALGFVIGGTLADAFGWRAAFLVTFVGLVPAALCFAMREPPRAARRAGDHVPYRAVLRELIGTRSFVYLCSGMTATTFILGGVATWAPEYIFQREARFAVTPDALARLGTEDRFLTLDKSRRLVPEEVADKLRPAADGRELTYDQFRAVLTDRLTREEVTRYAEPLTEAATAPGSITLGMIGLVFGAIVVVGGLVATLLGGVVGDRLRDRGVRGAYFQAAGWSTLLAWPFFVAMLFVPFPAGWAFLFAAVFFLFFNTGPANTVLANISRSPVRATAFAINILVIHALGDAISPPIIGFIADLSDLHTAFLVCSAFILLGGGLWVLGARHLDADTARAEAADRGAEDPTPRPPPPRGEGE